MSLRREKAEALLFELHRPADAEKVVREGLAADPNDACLHCLLSLSLGRQGRVRPALASARSAVALAPAWGYAHAVLGSACLRRGCLGDALDAFEEAVRLEPENPDYYHLWADALRSGGRRVRARKVAEQGLSLDPQHVGCRNTLATWLAEMGRYTEAAEQVRISLAHAPEDPYGHALLGRIWLNRGRPFRAARCFVEAVRLDPGREDSRLALREATNLMSYCIGWPVYAVTLAAVVTVASWAADSFRSVVVDSVAGVSAAMLLPLGCLVGRRFRETLALWPFRLGRSIHTPSDRRYAVSAAGAFVASAAAAVSVGLTAPDAPRGSSWELTPYLASMTFPLVPLVAWLDWRRVAPVAAALGALAWAAVQAGVIASAYAHGPARDTEFLIVPAMFLTFFGCVVIVAGNMSDDQLA